MRVSTVVPGGNWKAAAKAAGLAESLGFDEAALTKLAKSANGSVGRLAREMEIAVYKHYARSAPAA